MRGLPTTFLARLLAAAAVLALGRVVGSRFGVAARGVVEVWIVVRLGLHAVACRGLPTAVACLVAAAPRKERAAGARALHAAAWAGGLCAVLLAGVAVAAPRSIAPAPLALALALCATAPLVVAAQTAGAALLGAGRLHAWNALAVANRAAILVGLGVVVVAPPLATLSTVLLGLVAGEVASFALLLALLARSRGVAPLEPEDDHTLSRFARFSWANAVLLFALVHGDVVLVDGVAGPEQAGLYATARLAREVVLFLPWVAGMLLLPAAAAAGARRERTPRALGPLGLATWSCLAVGLVAFAEPFAVATHGEAFRAAAPLVRLLVPAGLLAGASHLALQVLLARGAARTVIAAPALALVVSAAANAWAVPRHGALGAAAVSLLAQATLLAACLVGLRAVRGVRPAAAGRSAGDGPAAPATPGRS